jgi:hypothetical protein
LRPAKLGKQNQFSTAGTLLTGEEVRALTPIPAGAAALDGEEPRPGEARLAGLGDPIGLVVPGCGDRTTAPSLPAWRWERSSPSLLWAMSRPGLRRTYAGIGRIRTATVVTGTIVRKLE